MINTTSNGPNLVERFDEMRRWVESTFRNVEHLRRRIVGEAEDALAFYARHDVKILQAREVHSPGGSSGFEFVEIGEHPARAYFRKRA